MKIVIEDISVPELATLFASAPAQETLTTGQVVSREFLKKLSGAFHDALSGNKIGAIKTVREITHCGLKEAKDVVEGVVY